VSMKRPRQSLQKPPWSHWLHSVQGLGRAPSQWCQRPGVALAELSGGIASIY
jgi:hypothetical protein